MQHTHTCLQIHTCEHAQSRINPHIRVWVSDHHGDQQEKASPRSTGLPQNARPPFPKPVMCRGKQASSSILSISLFHLKVHTVLKANSWLCTLMNANTDVDACSAQDIPNCILPRLPSESVSVPPKHTYSKRRIQWLEEFLGDGEADWNIKQASNNVSRKKKKSFIFATLSCARKKQHRPSMFLTQLPSTHYISMSPKVTAWMLTNVMIK